jgi:hypothetical protein
MVAKLTKQLSFAQESCLFQIVRQFRDFVPYKSATSKTLVAVVHSQIMRLHVHVAPTPIPIHIAKQSDSLLQYWP